MPKLSKANLLVATATAALMSSSVGAFAADKVSGDLSVSYNSHFVSYGADVWGAGDSFFGTNPTTFVNANLNFAVTDEFSIFLNGWGDLNHNAPSSIGGSIQEIDFNIGASYTFGCVTAGIAYGSWNYAGDEEQIVDLSLAFDDTGLIAPDFALSPSVTWHFRVDGNGAQAKGSAVALAIGPSFPLGEYATLTIPVGVTFFLDDDFQGGTSGGYAYSYLGASVGVPLTFIDNAYGDWSVNFDLTGYTTKSSAIPGNVNKNFVTGAVGLSVAF